MPTTDENILQEMLDRATNPLSNSVDEIAVHIFCSIVRSNADLINTAHDIITKKIFSKNNTEALRAIGVLEECMSTCGAEFAKKTAKFAFLNKLIQLVIDRHDGPYATIDVKRRVMDCLLLWTAEHSDKTKIREAYDNLKKQVNFEHSAMSSSATIIGEKRTSILGKDEDLVHKLLSEGGKENYKKVNLLIQHRYSQEAKRAERICQHKAILKETENAIDLLNEMLNNYSIDSVSSDDKETLSLLYNKCEDSRYKLTIVQERKCDFDEEIIADTVGIYDKLVTCTKRYRETVQQNEISTVSIATATTTTTAPKPDTTATNSSSHADILTELLGDGLSVSTHEVVKVEPTTRTGDPFNELSDIFGNIEMAEKKGNDDSVKTFYSNDLLGQLDVLEPITVFENNSNYIPSKLCDKEEKEDEKEKQQTFQQLKDIDKLSEELLLKSLNNEKHIKKFKREPEKLTLNDLAKDKRQTACDTGKQPKKKDDFIESKNAAKSFNNNSLDGNGGDVPMMQQHSVDGNSEETEMSLKILSSINIDLDQVTPLTEGQRVLLDDEHLEVILNLSSDRPQPNVYVMVLTINNKSREVIIKDLHFHAGVKKPCKVRLLPPSDTTLTTVKPFRPPVPINQIILLWNPTRYAVDLNGIITYKVGEDLDAFSEPITTLNIPCLR